MQGVRSHERLVGILVTAALALTASALIAPARAQSDAGDGSDAEDSYFQSTAEVGGHISNVTGRIERVREFDLGREEFQPDLWLDSSGFSGTNRFDLFLNYYDEQTMTANAQVDANRYVRAGFEHESFIHWLDHDQMQNLQWRELVGVDEQGNDRPGGKMITHDDTDPSRQHQIRYATTGVDLDVPLAFLPGSTLEFEYRDQQRVGTRQVTSTDHCSNCHIRGQTQDVNEQIRDFHGRFNAQIKPVWLTYEFYARDFDNNSGKTSNYYQEARHPVNGGSVEEFGSRLLYDDETLLVSDAADTEKYGHAIEARVDLPKSQGITGFYRYTTTQNARTKNKLKSSAGRVTWFAPLSKKLRLNANFMRRDIENTAVLIDLPNWRESRPGGGQDFDYTRYSAYDREEYFAGIKGVYALARGHSLRFGYQYHGNDRKYFELDPDDPEQTKTSQHKIDVAWNGRLSREATSRVGIIYESNSDPFVNTHGLCEAAIGDTVQPLPPGQPNDWIYYFQRQVIGTGTNRPTSAFRFRSNVTYAFNPKASLNGYLNYSNEKNDKINAYEYKGKTTAVGAQLMWMPEVQTAVVFGGSWSKITSNAKICATVMDG